MRHNETIRGQLDLFGGLAFGDVLPATPRPPVFALSEAPAGNTAGAAGQPAERDKAGKHYRRRPKGGRPAFEAWLRAQDRPYVAVDEANKAIFAGSGLKGFDFLIYSNSGPNLLILLASNPAEAEIRLMGQWEKIFGRGFAAVFVVGPETAAWRAIRLAEYRPERKAKDARPLAEML